MQNKQLQRQLKVIVQNLKGDQILKIIDSLQREGVMILNKNFAKSGINCTCCTLAYDLFTATGFGRNQHQALINATKNYIENLIATNSFVPQLRSALRQRENKSQIPIDNKKNQLKCEQSLILQQMRQINEMSMINSQQKQGCNCIYYEVHKHHISQIKNMQARMRLIMRQNQMLKQLLLKDVNQDNNFSYKQNVSCKANMK